MLDEHGVAAGHPDVEGSTVLAADGPYAQREPERVLLGPRHLQQVLVVEGVGRLPDLDEPYRLAVGAVRVGLQAGCRTDGLLEDQDVARYQGEPTGAGPVLECCRGRSGGQAEVRLAPRPHRDPPVRRTDGDVLGGNGLEDLLACPEPERARRQSDPGAGGQAHERPRGTAIVHRVVDEPGVTAHRGPQPGGVEVGLGADRVLPVAQLVPGVGEQLDQGDHEVGRVPLAPLRQRQAQTLQEGAPQTGVVLGQVVDDGLGVHRGWTGVGLAVGQGRAVLAEAELAVGEERVEPVDRLRAGLAERVGMYHLQAVPGDVSGAVHCHHEPAGPVGFGVRVRLDRDDPQVAGDDAAADPEVGGDEPVRRRAEQRQREPAPGRVDRHGLDPVVTLCPGLAGPRREGRCDGHRAPPPSKVSVRTRPVASTE